jgi:hydroxyethylthiazole kinase-like uncharacterized protein yjeF
MPGGNADKQQRGTVLVAGGSARVPGAVLLAGTAALRAGAGVLQMATVTVCASQLALHVPEALVISLAATRTGEIAGRGALGTLRDNIENASSVLLGCGMSEGASATALVTGTCRHMGSDATLVLDAGALTALHQTHTLLASLEGRAILTPHAGEMAMLLDAEKEDIEREPWNVARMAAERFAAVVVLKGDETWIGEPGGALFHYRGGGVGLGTSGSGDVLAGVITGLAARGATPLDAALSGVWAHGEAGRALARRIGTLGFLAREIAGEIPALLDRARTT